MCVEAGSIMELEALLEGYAKGAEVSEYGSLGEIAKAWITGEKVDWTKLWDGMKVNKIPLPGYPFEKIRCWLEDGKPVMETKKKVTVKAETKTEPKTKIELSIKKKTQENKTLVQNWMNDVEQYNGDEVKFEIVDNCIGIIKMQDRSNRNMFTEELVKGLIYYFKQINESKTIKTVIVTGYDEIFAMGGTKQTLENIANKKECCSDATFGYECMLNCKVPVIAAMSGHAFGGGLTFGLFADIVIASYDASYSVNFMQYGFTPGVGTTYILKDKLGSQLANEMMFSASLYSGQDLKDRGASILFENSQDVMKKAMQVAKSLVDKPLESLSVLKEELSSRVLKELPAIIESEKAMQEKTFSQLSAMNLIQKNFTEERVTADKKQTTGMKKLNVEKRSGAKNLVVRNEDELNGRLQLKKKSAQKVHVRKAETEKAPVIEKDAAEMTSFASSRIDMQKKKNSNIQISNTAKYKEIKNVLSDMVKEIIGEQNIQEELSFSELGVDSISGIELIREINHNFGTNLNTVAIYDYADINEMAKCIYSETAEEKEKVNEEVSNVNEVKPNPVSEKSQNTLGEQSMEELLEALYNQKIDLDTANHNIWND